MSDFGAICGANMAMPILVINMGGEMVYILAQRLRAQNVAPEKGTGGGGAGEGDPEDPFDLSRHETWYDLKPCTGMEVPPQGLGAIRLRT